MNRGLDGPRYNRRRPAGSGEWRSILHCLGPIILNIAILEYCATSAGLLDLIPLRADMSHRLQPSASNVPTSHVRFRISRMEEPSRLRRYRLTDQGARGASLDPSQYAAAVRCGSVVAADAQFPNNGRAR